MQSLQIILAIFSRTFDNQPYQAILELAIRYNMCDVEVFGNQAALLSALRLSHTTSHSRCVAVQSQCMGQPWYANHVQEWCHDNSTLHLKPSLKSYVISPRDEVDDSRRDPKIVQGQVTSSRLACLLSKGCQAKTHLQDPATPMKFLHNKSELRFSLNLFSELFLHF